MDSLKRFAWIKQGTSDQTVDVYTVPANTYALMRLAAYCSNENHVDYVPYSRAYVKAYGTSVLHSLTDSSDHKAGVEGPGLVWGHINYTSFAYMAQFALHPGDVIQTQGRNCTWAFFGIEITDVTTPGDNIFRFGHGILSANTETTIYTAPTGTYSFPRYLSINHTSIPAANTQISLYHYPSGGGSPIVDLFEMNAGYDHTVRQTQAHMNPGDYLRLKCNVETKYWLSGVESTL